MNAFVCDLLLQCIYIMNETDHPRIIVIIIMNKLIRSRKHSGTQELVHQG